VNKLTEFGSNPSETITQFIRGHGRPYDAAGDDYARKPFATDVRAGKNSPIYNAHSYHTKVPPDGIVPFILHYTETGDLVLDPFCGTGMTGIAALKEGRIAVLLDVSPIATFLSYNYCTPFDLARFIAAERRIQKEMHTLTNWLYETRCSICGRKSVAEYYVWSERVKCPRCGESFSLWDAAVNKFWDIEKEFDCPTCGKRLERGKCIKAGSDPGTVFYDCPSCGRKDQHVTQFDLTRFEEILRRFKAVYDDGFSPTEEREKWPTADDGKPLWFPKLSIMFKGEKWGDTWRAGYHKGITKIEDFYTKRNLWALAKLWYLITKVEDERTRKMLQFVFTSFNPSFVSKLTRFNFGKRGNSPLSGTLYVPSFVVERNISSIWETKRKSIQKLSTLIQYRGKAIVNTQSSTNLDNIPSDSIDYLFTDPPFGSNLMYSELNFIWESWLGRFTDTTNEAIVNKSQGKGITEYKNIMTRSFKEIYRVLKPDRWMTMVFHNSDGEVWQAIQDGLSHAGFVVGMIGIFDKKQRSFKQVTSSGAVGYDVVINCYKPKATVKNGIEGKTTNAAIVGFLADQLLKMPLLNSEDRTARKLHSKTIGFFMLQSKPLRTLSFEDFQKILKTDFREIDGYWYLPYQRPTTKGQKRLFGYISNESEAIEWLEELLKMPRKYGDIAPEFFKALGHNKLQKDLQELLHDNFVEDKEMWRNPTRPERESLIKRLTDKTARQIDFYLKGQAEYTPNDETLCEWTEFCYNSGLYKEGATLFHYIDEKAVSPEIFQKTRKIAEICKLKSWEGS